MKKQWIVKLVPFTGPEGYSSELERQLNALEEKGFNVFQILDQSEEYVYRIVAYKSVDNAADIKLG